MEVVMKSKSVYLMALVFLTLPTANCLAQDRVAPPEVHKQTPAAAPDTTTIATGNTSSSPNLLIGAGDLLEVSLYGMPDFKTDVRVSSGGEISLPLLGTSVVGGLSVEQAATHIE